MHMSNAWKPNQTSISDFLIQERFVHNVISYLLLFIITNDKYLYKSMQNLKKLVSTVTFMEHWLEF